MRKVTVLWINPYAIKEGAGFFRNKMGSVKAFAAFTTDQLELFTGNEPVFSLLVHLCYNEFHTDIFPGNLIDVQGNLCRVILARTVNIILGPFKAEFSTSILSHSSLIAFFHAASSFAFSKLLSVRYLFRGESLV